VEAHDMAVRRMVQAGAVPITWIALSGEWQRDWARESTLADAADLDRARWWKWGCIRLGDATSGRFQAVTLISAAISMNPIETLIKRNLHEVFG